MKTIKRLVAACIKLLVVGTIVINPLQSAFADIAWPQASVNTNAVVDALLAQVDGSTIQLDRLKEDGSGFADRYMFYWSGSVPVGSTRADVQKFEDNLLKEALNTIDLADQSMLGRKFSLLFSGFQYGQTNVNVIFGGGCTFQLDGSSGELKIPATVQVDLVESTLRYFDYHCGVQLAREKTPKLGVSIVPLPTPEIGPASLNALTTPSSSRAIQVKVSGKPGTTVLLYKLPCYGDMERSWQVLVATIVLDDAGNGVYLDKDLDGPVPVHHNDAAGTVDLGPPTGMGFYHGVAQ